MTHGEGSSYPTSAERCLICHEVLGYTGIQTLTHAVPYYGKPELVVYEFDGAVQRVTNVEVDCGRSFHLDCAAKHIKRCTSAGKKVTCPCCSELWPVSLETPTMACVLTLARTCGKFVGL